MLQRLGRARSAGGDNGTDTARAGAGGVGDLGGPAGAVEAGQVAEAKGPGGAPGASAAGAINGAAARPRAERGTDGGQAARADPARSAALPEDFGLPQQDPLRAFLVSQAGAVDISRLELASPALATLKAAGVVLVVPLVSSGELIGLLNLGPRLSEAATRVDDRQLLASLAGYAAPAMRVGQLVASAGD